MMREKDALLNPCAKRIGTSTYLEIDARAEATQPVSLKRNRRAGATVLFVLGLLLLLAIPTQLLAQSVGNIFGDVEDTTGAMIPGATVTVVSAERGVTRTVTSNSNGQFSIPSLPVGTYKITVAMDRFVNFERSGIVLDADSNVKLTCALQVAGAAPTTVEVQDTAAGVSDINLQSATVGTLIAPNIVEDMPLQDRSIVGVAQILPGVVDVNAPATFTGGNNGPTFSTAGSRLAANLFLFDGLMYNNLYRNTGLNYPPPDAIQEVSVLLNNYGAEYGRNTGGIFNAITKSGTNEMHGSLWEYNRNTALNAQNWYGKYTAWQNAPLTGGYQAPTKAQFIQNQFGSTFGGYILRNKLYYFAAYQGLRLASTATAYTAVTPTAAEMGNPDPKTGLPTTDASFADSVVGFSQAKGTTYTADNLIKNPIADTNQYAPFILPILQARSPICVQRLQQLDQQATANGHPGYLPGAVIPIQCLSTVATKIANKYFAPNGQYNPTGNGQFQTSGSIPKTDDNGFLRLDYNLGKHTLSGFYNIINADDSTVRTSGPSVTSYGIMTDWARSQFWAINDQWILSQSVLNTLRLGYRNFTDFTYPKDSTTAADLGITWPAFGTPTVPSITAGSVLALSQSGNTWSQNMNKSIEATDSISWTKGSHTFQFGATYLRLRYESDSDQATQGTFHFTTDAMGQSALTAFALGLLDGSGAVAFSSGRGYQGGVNNNYFFYATDNWRILKRLSLSLGLRYELPMPWYEPHDYWGTFSPGAQSVVMPNAPVGLLFPGDPGVPRGLVQTPKKQFMPRVGFSYDVFGTGKTALRGGFGMFYNAVNANIVQNGNQPWQCTYSSNNWADFANPLASIPGWGYCDPKNPTFSGIQTVEYPQANFRPSYAMAYNFGIQQQMPGKVALEINYVGKLGRHEMVVYQANPALYVAGDMNYSNDTDQRRMYQGFGDNLAIASIGKSNYNSLQAMATRRMSKGLTLTSSYTWGRSIDLNSGEFKGVVSEAGRIPYVWDINTERGPSDFNATHVFNAAWNYDLSQRLKYHGNAILSQAINGWSIGGTYSYRSGQPVNIVGGTNVSESATNDQRPVSFGDWRLPSGRSEADFVNAWFNNDSGSGGTCDLNTPVSYVGADGRTYTVTQCRSGQAWSNAPAGGWGDVSRNSVIGPPQTINNMSVKKNFKVKEGMSLQFRCDAYGVFNSPIFGKPTGGFGSNFGKITSTKGERQLQLSLKLKF
jgi:hypothetical protein